MSTASRARSSLHIALLFVGVGSLILTSVEVALIADARVADPLWAGVLFVCIGAVYVLAGLLAWWRRPTNGTGPLLVAAAAGFYLAGLAGTGLTHLTAVGLVCATLMLGVIIHLLVAFPAGRLRGRYAKALVAIGYFVALVMQAPTYLFVEYPGNPFAIVNDPQLATRALDLQALVGTANVLAIAVLLIGRLRRADSTQRRILAPVYTYGVVAILAIPVTARVLQPMFDLNLDEQGAIQLLFLFGIPLAFTIGLLLGGFARTGEVEELGDWLSNTTHARRRLTPVMARTLGDDSLQMLFWSDEHQIYTLPDGTPAELPKPGSGRGFIEFEVEGGRVGAITYDELLIGDPRPVRAAGRVAAIALAHERLTAELRASEEELRRSRLRIVEAADRERRRIARNLHDGLQVRLVLLALNAQQVADDPGIPAGSQLAATALRSDIDDAAAELRVLVHDVMPAALIERGLSAATEDLVDRVPLSTTLELNLTDGKLAAPVESTAYFVVAEALTNAMKYAAASHVDVRVQELDHLLCVEIRDDGRGGANPSGGTGLHGLADRVDTLGGRLQIDSPLGTGTRVMVELPCGS